MLNKVRNHFIDKYKAEARNHFRTCYQMIDVEPAQGLFNNKCFYNAVEYALNSKGVSVVEVMIIDGQNEPILHYVNQTTNGKYLETTLGHLAPQFEYYLIREVNKSDYHQLRMEFNRSCDYWSNRFVSWFGKKVLRIDRIV